MQKQKKFKVYWHKSIPYRAFNKMRRIVKWHMYERLAKKIKDGTKIQPNKIAIATNTFTYTCNPKYIYEEIIRRKLNYRIVWLTDGNKHKKNGYPDNVKTVNINSKEGIIEAYTSKLWLDNGIVFSDKLDKKKEQLHVQTMHGSLGIKRLDNAVKYRNKMGKPGRKVVYRESHETDYVITNSLFEENVFKTVFWKNTPMVRLGHARTDVLFEADDLKIKNIREELYKRYKIPLDKKLILYAPTHRTGLTAEDLYIDYRKLLDAFSERFKGEYAVMIRIHDRTKDLLLETGDYLRGSELGLYDVTDYPDMQELMLVADAGITDYSSWIFDFVLTKKPGFIFATDTERYNTNTGLYYPLSETPFPVARTSGELIQNIKEFDYEGYCRKADIFLDEKQSVDDGNSAARIVDWIETLVPCK